jgi:hypothetical protein
MSPYTSSFNTRLFTALVCIHTHTHTHTHTLRLGLAVLPQNHYCNETPGSVKPRPEKGLKRRRRIILNKRYGEIGT